jgi:hypothetical protein
MKLTHFKNEKRQDGLNIIREASETELHPNIVNRGDGFCLSTTFSGPSNTKAA